MTKWKVTQSHLIEHPTLIKATSLHALRLMVQGLADFNKRPVHRPFGQLDWRYELGEDDQVSVVYAYFKGRNNTRRRFMRLVKVADDAEG